METLLRRRRHLNSRIARLCNRTDSLPPAASYTEVKVLLHQIPPLWRDAEVLQQDIAAVCVEEEFDEYDQSFLEIFDRLDKLKLTLTQMEHNATAVRSHTNFDLSTDLEFPTFDTDSTPSLLDVMCPPDDVFSSLSIKDSCVLDPVHAFPVPATLPSLCTSCDNGNDSPVCGGSPYFNCNSVLDNSLPVLLHQDTSCKCISSIKTPADICGPCALEFPLEPILPCESSIIVPAPLRPDVDLSHDCASPVSSSFVSDPASVSSTSDTNLLPLMLDSSPIVLSDDLPGAISSSTVSPPIAASSNIVIDSTSHSTPFGADLEYERDFLDIFDRLGKLKLTLTQKEHNATAVRSHTNFDLPTDLDFPECDTYSPTPLFDVMCPSDDVFSATFDSCALDPVLAFPVPATFSCSCIFCDDSRRLPCSDCNRVPDTILPVLVTCKKSPTDIRGPFSLEPAFSALLYEPSVTVPAPLRPDVNMSHDCATPVSSLFLSGPASVTCVMPVMHKDSPNVLADDLPGAISSSVPPPIAAASDIVIYSTLPSTLSGADSRRHLVLPCSTELSYGACASVDVGDIFVADVIPVAASAALDQSPIEHCLTDYLHGLRATVTRFQQHFFKLCTHHRLKLPQLRPFDGWHCSTKTVQPCAICDSGLPHWSADPPGEPKNIFLVLSFCVTTRPPRARIKKPRCMFRGVPVRYQLHGFSDASEKAYAAVVYLRSVQETGEVDMCLVVAKTKVAPLKTVSIPRLELCTALLLAKVIELLKCSLKNLDAELYCWTDSKIVLAWLNSPSSRWKTFVANRVSKIQEIISPFTWRHVKSELNPADCASRGMSPTGLKNHQLWWQGPEFLQKEPLDILKDEIPPIEDAVMEEKTNRSFIHAFMTCQPQLLDDLGIIHRFSKLSQLLRVVAYIQRFVKNIKKPKQHRDLGCLTADDLSAALNWCILQLQVREFEIEIERLKQEKPLLKRSHILSLHPFLDEYGILRVGGRLQHSKIPPDQKFPILLPKGHHFTELVIRYFHVTHLHGGLQLTLAAIRQRYWIIAARDKVKQIIQKCVFCVRQRAKMAQQFMGDLPAARVNPSKPLQKTGIDYCGPVLSRAAKGRGRAVLKGYIAVFVCFSTRAIHLELVSDLTSEAFIAALKRFIARRGRCTDLFSDCGTNFVGASKKLARLITDQTFVKTEEIQIANYAASEGIHWHFLPPSAPHMGGLWEAGVKSVKHHLRRVLGNSTLTFEELTTVLAQIEACLNSRPITALPSNPDDLTALTPGHFLVGEPLTALPERNYVDTNDNRLRRWELVQKMVQHFWKRWHMEYLTRLQQRTKWMSPQVNIRIGDVVLLKEDNLPPMKWPLARVVDTYPGPDGSVRVILVKTNKGTIKRPVVKIAPLPVT